MLPKLQKYQRDRDKRLANAGLQKQIKCIIRKFIGFQISGSRWNQTGVVKKRVVSHIDSDPKQV